jgi:hypothetical protein
MAAVLPADLLLRTMAGVVKFQVHWRWAPSERTE